MVIRSNLPGVDASGTPARTLTLEELRTLVEITSGLDGALIVRVQAIPFHMPDLGNPLGSRCMVLMLDTEDGQGGARPNRAARRHKPGKFADGQD